MRETKDASDSDSIGRRVCLAMSLLNPAALKMADFIEATVHAEDTST
tara:strand:+ start:7311 stop:7451 length:141 start_codon:yes stop_codon:yes gene_type:complete